LRDGDSVAADMFDGSTDAAHAEVDIMRTFRGRSVSSWLALSGICAAALAAPALCHAEIYGWVDGNGTFTYSNLPPPDSARVTDVIPEDPAPSGKAKTDAARLAEISALNDRIRLLELEQARQRSEMAAAAAAPVYAPAAAAYAGGCGPDGTYDCSTYAAPLYLGGGWPVYYYRGAWRNGGRYAGVRPGFGGPSVGSWGGRPASVGVAHAGVARTSAAAHGSGMRR
jgi:hypothetical protein